MRLLVANRGEIACRIFRTARGLGYQTVAVYSEPDRAARHAGDANLAVALGGTTSAQSYLDIDKILAAAELSGATAIHPGYGFLSENPEFAERVVGAGLTWVGPTPESIRAMALKVEAKRLAQAAGVPLVPGAELGSQADVAAAGAAVGYPLLVKASAGGGGKGMRRVDSPEDLAESVAAARREAASAFGDDTVFLERYLESARHVEVQVFGDTHGNVVHLFERECSIQRRHQKVVEEAPSPGITDDLRDRMTAAAVALSREIGYVGAGTVEFMVAGQDYYFLEMNTRLQVEHPVTEQTTGVDLVAWQLHVAAGDPLPLRQDQITRTGHAIEVRLYAEDPAAGYLPNTGTLTVYRPEATGSVRVDDGFAEGDVVSSHYDPMLAKVIATAATRDRAAEVLADWLRRLPVAGVTTNRLSLAAILGDADFRRGETTTAFLDDHPDLLTATPEIDAVVVAVSVAHDARHRPATGPVGWRNVPAVPEWLDLRVGDGAAQTTGTLRIFRGRETTRYAWAQDALLSEGRDLGGVRAEADAGRVRVEIDGLRMGGTVEFADDLAVVTLGGTTTLVTVLPRFAHADHVGGGGGPATPVPGTITDVRVEVGDTVTAGQALVVLEAMKMEHTIAAAVDAVVSEVLVKAGQSVDAHQIVVTLEEV